MRDEWLPVKDAAFRLGVSTRTVWKLIAEGQLAANKPGPQQRKATVNTAAVRQYADALEAATLMDHPEMRTYGSIGPDERDRLFVRAVEAAQMLGLTRQRIEQLVRDGEIAAFRIGRCVLLRPKDVEGYKRWRDGEKRVAPPEATSAVAMATTAPAQEASTNGESGAEDVGRAVDGQGEPGSRSSGG